MTICVSYMCLDDDDDEGDEGDDMQRALASTQILAQLQPELMDDIASPHSLQGKFICRFE